MPEIAAYTINNSHGTSATILNYGLTVTKFLVPVKGEFRNIVLGFEDINTYKSSRYLGFGPSLGTIVGRYANRIKNASFELNGVIYTLPKNDGANTLHGGVDAFNKKHWQYLPERSDDSKAVFSMTSPHLDQGFPGQLEVIAEYTILDDNSLQITYHCLAMEDSVVNLTEHTYFNLDAHSGLINQHKIMAFVKGYLEQDESLCPTGEIKNIESFSKNVTQFVRLDEFLPHGIDTTFILDKAENTISHVGTILNSEEDLKVEIWTNAPCIHIYSGAMLPVFKESDGLQLLPFRGVCMECQSYTDSVNNPHFPETKIKAGETQIRTIRYTPINLS